MLNGFYAPLTTTELEKNANYDESDDEGDVGLDSRGTAAQPLPTKAGLRLPEKVSDFLSEGDVELESDGLREILTDTYCQESTGGHSRCRWQWAERTYEEELSTLELGELGHVIFS